MKTRIDGIDIDYDRYGKGDQTILFLHGWYQDFGHHKYRKLLNHLSKTYQVIALDFPGFGKSGIYSIPWTVFDFADFTAKFIKKLKIKSSILVGYSFGGRIAILLASDKNVSKLFSHLVLIDSAGVEIKNFKTRIIIYLSKLIPSCLKPKLSKIFNNTDYSHLTGVKKQTFSLVVSQDLQYHMTNITIPTLILWGGQDHTTPVSHAKIIKSKIKNSQLIVSANDNHGLPYRNPRFVYSHIYQFLSQ